MTITMQQEPMLKRGDVALVFFPNTDLVSAKTRPVVVVQANNLQTQLS
jgi:mRNA interferase MazF